MNTNAPIPPHEKALALATKRAIQSAGGLEVCEAETGISDTQLSRCCSVNHRDSITIRDAVTVDHLAASPMILQAMARQLGHVVVPRPEARRKAGDLAGSVIELGAEFGDVSRAVLAALHDGKCDPLEAGAALEQLAQMEEVSARLRLHLQLIADGPRVRAVA